MTGNDSTTGRMPLATGQVITTRLASFAFFRATLAPLFMGGRSYRSY